jgi:hypothetical protein
MSNIHPYVAMAEISWQQERLEGDVKRHTSGRRDGTRRYRVRKFRQGIDAA